MASLANTGASDNKQLGPLQSDRLSVASSFLVVQ